MTSEGKSAAKWLSAAWGLWAAGMASIAVWSKEWSLLVIIPAFILPLTVGIGFTLAKKSRKEAISP